MSKQLIVPDGFLGEALGEARNGLAPVLGGTAGKGQAVGVLGKGVTAAGTTGKTMHAMALGNGGAAGSAVSQVALAVKGAGSSILNTGFNLGLGAGLGIWGPILALGTAVAVGVGVCNHLRQRDRLNRTSATA